MLVDGEYYQGVTPESAVEILYGLAPDETTAAREGSA
jgi:hypothetical protein